MEEQNEKKNDRVKTIVIIILIILLMAALVILGIMKMKTEQPVRTAVLEAIPEEQMTLNDDGMVDVKINQFITVKNGIMQDLQFKNTNVNRVLRCKIKFNDEYVYDSNDLEPGMEIVGDYINTENMKFGTNEAVAEVTSYSLDGIKRMQLNVELKLTYVS